LQAVWNRVRMTESFGGASELLRPACGRYEVHGTLAARAARCWSEVAFLALELGDHVGARTAWERAARLDDPGSPESPREAPGYRLFVRGDVGSAVSWFARAVAARPKPEQETRWWERYDTAALQVGLGRALRTAGKVREARRVLESSVAVLVPIARDRPAAAIERRLGRARAELAHALRVIGAPAREVAASAAPAAAWFDRAGGPQTEIEQLKALAGIPP
jgi:hypothetical protein